MGVSRRVKDEVRFLPGPAGHGHLNHVQRIGIGDHEVGVQGKAHARLLDAPAPAEAPHALGPEHAVAHPDAPEVDMPDQEARRDAEVPHAGDLVVVQHRQVFDPGADAAHVDAGVPLGLAGVEHHVDPGIAVGVERKRPALSGPVEGHGRHLPGRHVGGAAAVGAEVGLALEAGEAWFDPSATSL
jgi:hypothetical protein